MPVPVNVTHANRAGLDAAKNAVLQSEGPFARAAAAAKEAVAVNSEASPAAIEASTACGQQQAPASDAGDVPALATNSLNFWYTDIDGRPIANKPPVVQDMTVSLPRGATCLLIGPNGAGKTTLLKVLGGKHMVPQSAVSVLGQPPFHGTNLTSSGALSYIGGNWERDIAFAGYSVPLAGDMPASQMLNSLPGTDPARLARLIEVLDIDPTWRMHLVSDGQRRRVQIAMGLLKPFQVLLLDEITVDLDVLGRAELMNFLKEECAQRGATIIYATHIFDGLESWPSHVMYVARGQLQAFERAESIPELREGRLLDLVEKWLRAEKAERDAEAAAAGKITGGPALNYGGDKGSSTEAATWNNGWAAGRLTSSMKLSSNAVMRM